MKNDFHPYYKAVKYLESIPIISKADYFTKKSGRSLFLKRFAYFLDLLDNPQDDLKFIHIAGSTGKGSVAYMVESILTQAKYNTGLYTSPHCTTTIERFKAGGKFISPNEFTKIVNDLKPKITQAAKHSPYGRPSYFEILTAIAFLYFKKQKCYYVVLETGLGGRYDSTNIIKQAEATIINLIDFDHVDILGQKLINIAKEKAAIIKPKTTVFTTSKNEKAVIKILRLACQKNKTKLKVVRPPKTKYRLPLLGDHQQDNAEIAAQVCAGLGVSLTNITAGLQKIKMPCRFEIIQTNPTIIIDCAHNESKMNSTIKILENLTYKKLYPIIALTKERDAKKIFKRLISKADKVFITNFTTDKRKKYLAKDLAKDLQITNAIICTKPLTALTKARNLANNEDVILITGSIYLAGEIRNHFIKEKVILKNRQI